MATVITTPSVAPEHCASLAEVRSEIDVIDRQLVGLIARRSGYVSRAAAFKADSTAVRAPDRVAQVMAKATTLADAAGAPKPVVAAVFTAMIDAFIAQELAMHAQTTQGH
jgi:isochorismate pyruvate lyase